MNQPGDPTNCVPNGRSSPADVEVAQASCLSSLDDATVEEPPPKRQGTLKVRMVYLGRDKPAPADDPRIP